MATVKCARGKRGSPSNEMDEYIKRKTVIDLITRRYENPEICTQEINSIPAADAQGIKESIAMDIERYGDCKIVSITSDRGREEQLRTKGAKL